MNEGCRMGVDYPPMGDESVTIYGKYCTVAAVGVDRCGALVSNLQVFVAWGRTEQQRDKNALAMAMKLNGSLN